MQTFPDQQFEIINLSLTAVNSYTVLGFAKELVNYEPDAVLIYSGQNEYYGTLGWDLPIRYPVIRISYSLFFGCGNSGSHSSFPASMKRSPALFDLTKTIPAKR